MKKENYIILIFSIWCTLGSAFGQNNEVGKPYKGWSSGELDIHHIYTGRAESSFLIAPDGTSILIDAGDYDPTKEQYGLMTPMLPDSSKRAGQRIAEYINSVNPQKDMVDYLLITHFHSDHTGDAKKGIGVTTDRQPNYQLSGITEVAEHIRFGKIIDRDYPNYNFPLPLDKDVDIENYHNFIKWQVLNNPHLVERFRVGSTQQFVLKHKPKKHKDFSISNLFANGQIWNFNTSQIDTLYHQENQSNKTHWNENTMSCGIRLNYGPFSYYSGGDLSGQFLDENGNKVDIEGYAASICGEVDVAKANHHAYLDAMTEGFIKNINSNYFIVPVWDFAHIQPSIIERITDPKLAKTEANILFTHFPDSLRAKYQDTDWINKILSDGHIVIKVLDNGEKFKIYSLDVFSEEKNVKAVYGPFDSKGNKK